jgi:hypothetical protein
MVSMVLSCKALAPALVFVELLLAYPALIPFAKSTKVCPMMSACPTFSCLTPNTGSVGLVSRFGKFYKSVDPGLVQVNVCTESLRVVDVKIQISPIGRQTVM